MDAHFSINKVLPPTGLGRISDHYGAGRGGFSLVRPGPYTEPGGAFFA